MSNNITYEIERLRVEIETLKEVIATNPAGRYVRALQARERDYGKLIHKRGLMGLARQLPRYSQSARIGSTADSKKSAEMVGGAA
jgi:hypothetical protein